jgi:predicted enzyme related to lactoylglutathione lyase
MRPSAIPFTLYPVSNVPRAREFYQRVFGLTETANWENHWIEFDVGAGTLALTDGLDGHIPGAKGAVLAFEVDDLAAFGRHLASLGLAWAGGPFDSPLCVSATVQDPDGNVVMVHHRKT